MSEYQRTRNAQPGDLCTCGRPAVEVFVYDDRESGYCGLEDGGGRVAPCPFCGAPEAHLYKPCPQYTVNPGASVEG